MPRQLTYAEAILEAQDQAMQEDTNVFVMGLGVPDPKAIFGTCAGLREKYGPLRAMDMPVSENGMTGVAIGAALRGKRPILTHQRLDFLLLSLDQIINNAAKWHFMFNGQGCCPLVIRAVIGRGWGQGPQHSQSLQALFTHIPGLRVVMPSTPYQAKGLLLTSIKENNPVIFLEHRWLHNTLGEVPEEPYYLELGKGEKMRAGDQLTCVSSSYMTLEAIKVADELGGIDLIDLPTLAPYDLETICASVRQTGRLLVVEGAHRTGSFAAEIVAEVTEREWGSLRCPPRRICLPDYPVSTSHALSFEYYPRAAQIGKAVCEMTGRDYSPEPFAMACAHDVPDPSFTGPF